MSERKIATFIPSGCLENAIFAKYQKSRKGTAHHRISFESLSEPTQQSLADAAIVDISSVISDSYSDEEKQTQLHSLISHLPLQTICFGISSFPETWFYKRDSEMSLQPQQHWPTKLIDLRIFSTSYSENIIAAFISRCLTTYLNNSSEILTLNQSSCLGDIEVVTGNDYRDTRVFIKGHEIDRLDSLIKASPQAVFLLSVLLQTSHRILQTEEIAHLLWPQANGNVTRQEARDHINQLVAMIRRLLAQANSNVEIVTVYTYGIYLRVKDLG